MNRVRMLPQCVCAIAELPVSHCPRCSRGCPFAPRAQSSASIPPVKAFVPRAGASLAESSRLTRFSVIKIYLFPRIFSEEVFVVSAFWGKGISNVGG